VKRYKAEIITFDGNFHGRTISIVSFSNEELYREDFGPFTPGFVRIPYGDDKAVIDAINVNTIAVLIEPIQGEAGVIVPPAGFLKKLRETCTRYGVLMIADEIQTGLGRTGRLLACHHEDVRPDLVILGKALSGGFFPVSAVVGDRNVMGLLRPGEHGSTFGGNPLAAAVARTSLRVLVEEGLIDNAAQVGEYFMDQLSEINSPHIKEVRGKGLLIGVELKVSAGGARRFCNALVNEGILAKDTHEHVIRFAPPLIMDRPTVDWAVDRIRKVLTTT
jgi:ornithine--oxo-acid transaminase